MKQVIHNYIIPKFIFSKVVTKHFMNIQKTFLFRINIEQWLMRISKINIVNIVLKQNNAINLQVQMKPQVVDDEHVD